MQNDSPNPSEVLAAQCGRVHSVARRLVGDVHQAEDLAQDALVAALGRGANVESRPGGWWALVVRNLSRTRRRADRRRARREREAARPGSVEAGTPRAVDEALLAAVGALPDPYRDTIRLRYLEQLSCREVARRLACPESTVASRSAEGLRRLRRLLDRSQPTGRPEPRPGSRGVNLPAFLSTLPRPRASAWAYLGPGVWIVNGTLKLGLIASLATAALVGVAYRFGPSPDPVAARKKNPAVSLDSPTATPLAVPAREPEGRREIPLEGQAPASVGAPHAGTPVGLPVEAALDEVRGRVIDLAGTPVPAVRVCAAAARSPMGAAHASAGGPCTTADQAGRFEFTDARSLPGMCRLLVESDAFATVYQAQVLPHGEGIASGTDSGAILVVAPRIPFAGRVVDPDGAPVEGAELQVWCDERPFRLPGTLLRGSVLVAPHARSDAEGAFTFDQVAELSGARVLIRARGFADQDIELPQGGDPARTVVLEPLRSGPGAIIGQVLLPTGEPADAAWVSWGQAAVQADSTGAFAFDLAAVAAWASPPGDAPYRVVATLPGFRPASAPSPSLDEARATGSRKPLVLQLGPAPSKLEGRVVDGDGRPLAGIRVRAVGETRFGLIPSALPGQYVERTVEEMSGGGVTRTDGEGRFELEGLASRPYRIEALEHPSLVSAMTDEIQPGTAGITVRLDVDAARAIEGRVVDRRGDPIDGVRVYVSRHWPGSLEIGAGGTSGEDGRFRIEGATPRPAFLRIQGEGIVPDLFHDLPKGADLGDLEVRVSRRCWLQVEFGDWAERADVLQVEGADGTPLELVLQEGQSIGIRDSLSLGKGLSAAFAIDRAATTVVLRRGAREVTRYPVEPVPGEVVFLQL